MFVQQQYCGMCGTLQHLHDMCVLIWCILALQFNAVVAPKMILTTTWCLLCYVMCRNYTLQPIFLVTTRKWLLHQDDAVEQVTASRHRRFRHSTMVLDPYRLQNGVTSRVCFLWFPHLHTRFIRLWNLHQTLTTSTTVKLKMMIMNDFIHARELGYNSVVVTFCHDCKFVVVVSVQYIVVLCWHRLF